MSQRAFAVGAGVALALGGLTAAGKWHDHPWLKHSLLGTLGSAPSLLDDEASTFISQAFQRADAFLFGRRTYEKPGRRDRSNRR
jgi:hypothetical protein